MSTQRTPKELMDNKIPYSDMTEDEIESIIEYKAQYAITMDRASERSALIKENNKARIEMFEQEAAMYRSEFDSLVNTLLGKSV